MALVRVLGLWSKKDQVQIHHLQAANIGEGSCPLAPSSSSVNSGQRGV